MGGTGDQAGSQGVAVHIDVVGEDAGAETVSVAFSVAAQLPLRPGEIRPAEQVRPTAPGVEVRALVIVPSGSPAVGHGVGKAVGPVIVLTRRIRPECRTLPARLFRDRRDHEGEGQIAPGGLHVVSRG